MARVVGGLTDPDPRVAGQGFALLRANGVEVEANVLPEDCRRAHRGHILRVTENRPMVTLKIAQTADGQAAGGEHDQRLSITGLAANLRTHVLRAMHDAIMVGIGTVLGDDPLMTVRLPGCDRRPLRVVLDARLDLPLRSRLVASAAGSAGAGYLRRRGGRRRARRLGQGRASKSNPARSTPRDGSICARLWEFWRGAG